MSINGHLHLPQLAIGGFRGIDNLVVPRLGRVTLLAGKNSVGKTTVLDAVRLYASRGRYSTLHELLRDRHEVTETVDEDGDRANELDWRALFHGRSPGEFVSIVVGPDHADQLELQLVDDPQQDMFPDAMTSQHLKVVFRDREYLLDLSPRRPYSYHRRRPLGNGDEPSPSLTCEYLGPGMLNERQTSRLWDQVALTDDESRVLDALNLVMDGEVSRVSMVGEGREVTRRPLVRLKSQSRPVPLKSLGDGAVRLFGIALALANSSGGFLLIDEAENGIHHTVQRDLWSMILRTAHDQDIQVLGTTHSWDCVRGFARAATEFEHGEGVLIRLDRDAGELRAVDYSEDDLRTAAEQGVEVR